METPSCQEAPSPPPETRRFQVCGFGAQSCKPYLIWNQGSEGAPSPIS